MSDEIPAGNSDPAAAGPVAEPAVVPEAEPDFESEDVEAHGIEVEDDTEAAVFDVNFG